MRSFIVELSILKPGVVAAYSIFIDIIPMGRLDIDFIFWCELTK